MSKEMEEAGIKHGKEYADRVHAGIAKQGFLEGARWAIAECAKVAERYGDAHETWRGYAIESEILKLVSEAGSKLFENKHISPEDARLAREVNKRSGGGK